MTVSNILSVKGNSVVTAASGDTVGAVAKLLAEKKIGAVVIVDSALKIEGIVSERDVVREIANNGADILSQNVSAIMTKKVITCSPGDTIADLMQSMTGGKFRHLPVVEGGKLAGVISIGDVVKARIAEAEQEAAAMREYITTG